MKPVGMTAYAAGVGGYEIVRVEVTGWNWSRRRVRTLLKRHARQQSEPFVVGCLDGFFDERGRIVKDPPQRLQRLMASAGLA